MQERNIQSKRLMKMKAVLRGLASVMLLVSFLIPSVRASDGWLETYGAAVAEAKRTGKPILADFSTSWCGSCRDLERYTFRDPAIIERLDGFVKLHVDGDRYPEMVNSYSVSGYPTLVSLTPDGRELNRSVGFVPAAQLASHLDGVMARYTPIARRAHEVANSKGAGDEPDDETVTDSSATSHGSTDESTEDETKPDPKAVARANAATAKRYQSNPNLNFYMGGGSQAAAKSPREVAVLASNAPASRIQSFASAPGTPQDTTRLVSNPYNMGKTATAGDVEEPKEIAQAPAPKSDSAGAPEALPRPLLNAGATRDSAPVAVPKVPVAQAVEGPADSGEDGRAPVGQLCPERHEHHPETGGP